MIFVLPQWGGYLLESLTWEHWEKWSISYRHAFTRCCLPLSQPCNCLVRRFMMGDVPSVIASIWINSCPYLLSWSAKILEGKATSQSWGHFLISFSEFRRSLVNRAFRKQNLLLKTSKFKLRYISRRRAGESSVLGSAYEFEQQSLTVEGSYLFHLWCLQTTHFQGLKSLLGWSLVLLTPSLQYCHFRQLLPP